MQQSVKGSLSWSDGIVLREAVVNVTSRLRSLTGLLV